MAQLSDDCFAFGGPLLSVEDALARIAGHVAVSAGAETVPLLDADGRVLAEDVAAPIPLPPFANSAVDGYAVRHADLVAGGVGAGGDTVLPVRGRLAAGAAGAAPLEPGTARRIFTGAPMPDGADTVFMQEDVRLDGGGRVVLPAGLKPGANARPRGEDIVEGALALPAGRRLRPQDLGLAAALGLTRLPVRRRLRVCVFSTGDEVAAPGGPLPPGRLYDANRALLGALARRAGAEVSDGGILADAAEATARALRGAADAHDLVLTSGGVSTGEEDHVKAAMEAAGRLVSWRLAVKPGRPVAMGVVRGAALVGLPGNPVAAFVTFAVLVRPLLARMGGEVLPPRVPLPVRAGFAYRKKAGRREYVRARLAPGPRVPSGDPAGGDSSGGPGSGPGNDSADVVAHKHERDGAGILTSLTETAGLVELPEPLTRVAPGDTVGFLPYAALL